MKFSKALEADLNASLLPTEDKDRKALPLFTFLTEYFVKAFIEVCRVAVLGNEQHNKGQPLHWARHKSVDQMNTAFRHMLDHKSGTTRDTDGAYHLAKAIWRLSAELELTIEADVLGITVKELVARLQAAAVKPEPIPEVTFSTVHHNPGCLCAACDDFGRR